MLNSLIITIFSSPKWATPLDVSPSNGVYHKRKCSTIMNDAKVSLEGEVWLSAVGYEGLYEVSNFARVWSVPRVSYKRNVGGKMLTIVPATNGYRQVDLSANGITKRDMLHRVVAKAFLPNPDNLREVNHIDGDKTNNHLSNLEWLSSKDNKKHAWEMGLYNGDLYSKPGMKNPRAILTDDIVRDILRDLEAGLTQNEIMKRYNILQCRVSSIKCRQTWKHITI